MMRVLSRNVPCRSLGCRLAWQQPSRWGHVAASILTAASKTRSYIKWSKKPPCGWKRWQRGRGAATRQGAFKVLPGVPRPLSGCCARAKCASNETVGGEARVAEGDACVCLLCCDAARGADAPAARQRALAFGEAARSNHHSRDSRLLVINKHRASPCTG